MKTIVLLFRNHLILISLHTIIIQRTDDIDLGSQLLILLPNMIQDTGT